MKQNRIGLAFIPMVVLAVYAGILVGGCASTGQAKQAGSEVGSLRPIDEPSTAPEVTSGSSPEKHEEPVVNTVGSGEKPQAQKAILKGDADRSKKDTVPVRKGADRVLFGRLSNLNWDRIVPVLGGIAVMSLIWGLAFWLARMPLRRRRAGLRRVVHRPRSVPEIRPSSESAYRTA
jgi:hypothetical protein